jgi:hypothetical protein
MSGRRFVEPPPEAAVTAPLAIVASNYRPIGKNTLVASVDLTIRKWGFVFRGCLWHRRGEHEWINFPAKELIDQAGTRKFSNLGEFINHEDARQFQGAALAAVHELAARVVLVGTPC